MLRFSHIAICILSLACTSPALATGTGSGYAWANNPKGQSYQPNANYAYSASGGAIQIRRHSLGSYQVIFQGLGGNGQAGGHVQVTAYGGSNEHCKVARWDSEAKDFIVHVNCFSSNGQPVDTQYTVNVAWPPSTQQPKVEVFQPGAAGGAIKRSIKPNGNVELRYPDGKIEELFPGGKRVTLPDGTTQRMMYSTQAPAAIPPSVPDNAERAWLAEHSDGLLSLITVLVGNDQSAVQSYMAFETPGASLYEQIAKRSQTLHYLVTP